MLKRNLGLVFAAGGLFTLLLVMAYDGHVWRAGLWGTLIAIVSAFALSVSIVPRSGKPSIRAKEPFDKGWLVVALVSILLFFGIASMPLWDPWETHYAEVAREILARNDWVSLWWAQDQFFWSKPILLFWLEALSLSAFGIEFWPDRYPEGAELAIRLPVYALTVSLLCFLYASLKRLTNRSAAILSVIVVGTCPQFVFLSRQAITDMPLVVFMSVAVVSLAQAIDAESSQNSPRFHRLIIAAFAAVTLPQALYLLSLNLDWQGGASFAAVSDTLLFGSPHNAGVPGNPAEQIRAPWLQGWTGQPALQGAIWCGVDVAVLIALRRFTSSRDQWMALFYICCGLAFMAKGVMGVAIPGVIALLYLIVSGRWSLLTSGALRVGTGIILSIAVALPWYLAMFVRHGPAFLNRLLVHDHINRLAAGVHGDKGAIDYFLGQISFGTFPWVALIPLALVVGAKAFKGSLHTFLVIWFVACFVLFNAMVTKFHHYIFPALIPLAILIGCATNELLRKEVKRGWLSLLAFGVCITIFVGRDLSWATSVRPQGQERLIGLFVYNYNRAWPEHIDFHSVLGFFAIAACVACAGLVVYRIRRYALAALVITALGLTCWITVVYTPTLAPHWSSGPLVRQYYASRNSENEPLIAWQMNWKGENYYTGNRVHVFAKLDNVELKKWLKNNDGRVAFVIFERKRMASFKKIIAHRSFETLTSPKNNHKFVLVRLPI